MTSQSSLSQVPLEECPLDDILILDDIGYAHDYQPILQTRPLHYMPISDILKRLAYRRQSAKHSQLVRDVIITSLSAPPKTKPRSKSI